MPTTATAGRKPSSRFRNGTYQFRIVNKKMLGDKQLWFTYDDEKKGEEATAAAVRQLKAGIMPDSIKARLAEISKSKAAGTGQLTLGALAREFMADTARCSEGDTKLLTVVRYQFGNAPMADINHAWGEAFIRELKNKGRASNTIRHYINALRRCFRYHIQRGTIDRNPFATLTESYAIYTDQERRMAEKRGLTPSTDQSRDRRLDPDEEKEIRRLLAGGEYDRKCPRRITIFYQAAMECLFDLALETAMRLSEMTTLYVDQIDFDKRTIFLGGKGRDGKRYKVTKNGELRQIPMTTVCVKALKTYMKHVEKGTRAMDGFSFDGGRLFPFWNGKLDGFDAPDKKSITFTAQELSKRWANIFKIAGCPDFHFHDLRHESISRFFERTDLDAIAISRISGHKKLEMLRRYSNLRASKLVDKLW